MYKYIVKLGGVDVCDPRQFAGAGGGVHFREIGSRGPIMAYGSTTTTYAGGGESSQEAQWADARAVLQAYILNPSRPEATANTDAFYHALEILNLLKMSEIQCPVPFIDSDGDALLMWEKGKSVFVLTVADNSLSLLVHADNRLAFASGEMQGKKEFSAEIWKQLQELRRTTQTTMVAVNSTTANSYHSIMTYADMYSTLKCIDRDQVARPEMPSLPCLSSRNLSRQASVENQSYGPNTTQLMQLTPLAAQKQQEISYCM